MAYTLTILPPRTAMMPWRWRLVDTDAKTADDVVARGTAATEDAAQRCGEAAKVAYEAELAEADKQLFLRDIHRITGVAAELVPSVGGLGAVGLAAADLGYKLVKFGTNQLRFAAPNGLAFEAERQPSGDIMFSSASGVQHLWKLHGL